MLDDIGRIALVVWFIGALLITFSLGVVATDLVLFKNGARMLGGVTLAVRSGILLTLSSLAVLFGLAVLYAVCDVFRRFNRRLSWPRRLPSALSR